MRISAQWLLEEVRCGKAERPRSLSDMEEKCSKRGAVRIPELEDHCMGWHHSFTLCQPSQNIEDILYKKPLRKGPIPSKPAPTMTCGKCMQRKQIPVSCCKIDVNVMTLKRTINK